MVMNVEEQTVDTVSLAAELTAAWLGNPNTRVAADEVPAFLTLMHETLQGLGPAPLPVAEEEVQSVPVAAVSARKSLANPAHIISMIDGKSYKTLRRHLSTHGLTPEAYRARYGLKDDYPMVAPAYSEQRRAMAKQLGLGRKPAPAAVRKAPSRRKRGE